ncbi:MAG TPA: response regulator [Thermoanaerobaculia bacterium]|nr:response regulator [Thermoanaerobaculia bacterium]
MHAGTVLVVEDDDAIRKLLVDFLHENSDVEVEGARDAVEALHLMSSKAYTVVVLDLMMPLMSGIDFLTSLEALTWDPSVKSLDQPPRVIVITAAPQSEVPSDTIEHRFARFVRGVFRKPLDMGRFGETVERELVIGDR